MCIYFSGSEGLEEKKAYNCAIRLLGRREHSEVELSNKLRQKFSQLSPAKLEKITADLKRQGLLSDIRFAESLIRSRTSRGYGPYYIVRELASKGIDSELAEHQLDETKTDWLQLAKDLVARRHDRAGEDVDAWARAIRFLQRRGFSGDLVGKAVGERPRNDTLFSGSD